VGSDAGGRESAYLGFLEPRSWPHTRPATEVIVAFHRQVRRVKISREKLYASGAHYVCDTIRELPWVMPFSAWLVCTLIKHVQLDKSRDFKSFAVPPLLRSVRTSTRASPGAKRRKARLTRYGWRTRPCRARRHPVQHSSTAVCTGLRLYKGALKLHVRP
jgi:hypothetical protein